MPQIRTSLSWSLKQANQRTETPIETNQHFRPGVAHGRVRRTFEKQMKEPASDPNTAMRVKKRQSKIFCNHRRDSAWFVPVENTECLSIPYIQRRSEMHKTSFKD